MPYRSWPTDTRLSSNHGQKDSALMRRPLGGLPIFEQGVLRDSASVSGSTLLRIIDGLLEPTDGQIYVDGGAVKSPGRDRAMVFQQDALLPWKTVIENVSYGLTLARIPKAQAHATAQRFINLAGLRGFEHHYPHQLSGGM